MLYKFLHQRIATVLGNVGLVSVLFFALVYISLNHNKFPEISIEDKVSELTTFLQNQVNENLGIVGIANAQQNIELVGPPDRTKKKKREAITLRWSYPALGVSERYVVAVAYYRGDERQYPFEPAVEYFETSDQVFQLPQLNTSPSISVIAWMVYISSGNYQATGAMSGTNHLFYIHDGKSSGGYQSAPDF